MVRLIFYSVSLTFKCWGSTAVIFVSTRNYEYYVSYESLVYGYILSMSGWWFINFSTTILFPYTEPLVINILDWMSSYLKPCWMWEFELSYDIHFVLISQAQRRLHCRRWFLLGNVKHLRQFALYYLCFCGVIYMWCTPFNWEKKLNFENIKH